MCHMGVDCCGASIRVTEKRANHQKALPRGGGHAAQSVPQYVRCDVRDNSDIDGLGPNFFGALIMPVSELSGKHVNGIALGFLVEQS